jgi:hypothetical protein
MNHKNDAPVSAASSMYAREVSRFQAVGVPVEGVQMNAPVVNSSPDPAGCQTIEQLIARQRRVGFDQHLVEVACVPGIRLGRRRRPDRQSGQQLVVAIPQLGSAIDPPVQARKLVQTDRRLDIGHVVLVAGLDHLVMTKAHVREPLPRADTETVERQPLDPRSDLDILGYQRPALDRRDVLRDIERKRRHVSERANPPASPLRPDRMRSILDNQQPVAVPQRVQAVHLDRPPSKMHRHDRPCPGSDRSLGGIEIDQTRTRHGINQHRRRASMLHRVRRRHERHRRNQHLVALAYPEHPQRQDQRSGAGRHAPTLAGAHIIADHPLEALDLGPGTDPPRAQRVDNLGYLLIADHRTAENQKAVPH